MKLALVGLSLFLVASLSTAKAQLLQNGSFQDGDFTDWNPQYASAQPGFSALNTPPDYESFYVQSGSIPPTGAYPGTNDAAAFGTAGSYFDYISQSFTSTIGTTYQLSFALQTFGNPNEFLADIGGTLNLSSQNGTTSDGFANYITGGTFQDIHNTSTDSWSVITLDYTATSASTEVIFGGVNNNATGVDDLTAVSVEAVPEPSAYLLSLIGLGFLAFEMRRRAVIRVSALRIGPSR